MAPKSMLRLKLAVSPISDFTESSFLPVIDEIEDRRHQDIDRIVLCSGKIFYDLLVAREERVLKNVAIVRIEELYPFPEKEFGEILAQYRDDADLVWVQEEAENQGAWLYIRDRLGRLIGEGRHIEHAARDEAASPATGSHDLHVKEHAELMDRTFKMQIRVSDQESEANAG
jgi:2-oxoglutarate dehydrogenase E1 component